MSKITLTEVQKEELRRKIDHELTELSYEVVDELIEDIDISEYMIIYDAKSKMLDYLEEELEEKIEELNDEEIMYGDW